MEKRGIRKPTGVTGPVRIHGTFPDVQMEFQKVDFPLEKAEIETFVVESFLLATKGKTVLKLPFVNLRRNSLDDYDFTDIGATRLTHLELMEMAPMESTGGGYYGAPSSYNSYDFARAICDKLLAKSSRYSVPAETRLVLLMYTTDWHFHLSETAVTFLQYLVGQVPHVFSEVYAYSPRSQTDGHPYLIHPVPRSFFRGFDPEKHRDSETYNANPEDFVLDVDPEHGQISVGWTVPVAGPAISKVGRNVPCPCGSGRKYKRCHGR